MSNVVPFDISNAVAVVEAIKSLPTMPVGGKPLLKMTKAGTWVLGPESEPVEPGAHVLVNLTSLSTGYIAWEAGKIEAEVMRPITMGPVTPDMLPPVSSKRGWEAQVMFEAVIEEGPEVIWKSSSHGGREAFLRLITAIKQALTEDTTRVVPKVKLASDSYNHPEYGKIFKPKFEIVSWVKAEEALL